MKHALLTVLLAASPFSQGCRGKPPSTPGADGGASVAVAVPEPAPDPEPTTGPDAGIEPAGDASDAGGVYPCSLDGLANGELRVSETGRVELVAGGKRRALLDLGDDFVFNAAKSYITCDKQAIEIASQMPFSAAMYTAALRWDGEGLSLTGTTSEDPSAEATDKLERHLRRGKIAEAIAEREAIEYPHRYFDEDEMTIRIVTRAAEVAAAHHRAGRTRQAADVLAAALAHAEIFEIPAKLAVRVKNDHGFFLDRLGRRAEAERVLREVVAAAPDRAVARLNLADCLHAQGKLAAARAEYAAYARLTPRPRWPARVTQRCPNCR
jgi:tetratricopeptide (TPR) repeat protein